MDYEDSSIAVSPGYFDPSIRLCSTCDSVPFSLGETGVLLSHAFCRLSLCDTPRMLSLFISSQALLSARVSCSAHP